MNRKILIALITLLMALILSVLYISNTISLEKYLLINPKNANELKINTLGYVQYGNKVILKDNLIPLSKNTAITTIEIKIVSLAEKILPKKDCDPANTRTNGTIGCYIDNPDNN